MRAEAPKLFRTAVLHAVANILATGLYVAVSNAGGSPVGGEFEIAEQAPFGGGNPKIAMLPAGEFVVVWFVSESQIPIDFDVRGRRFASDGTALGTEFLVNTYTTGIQHFVNIGSGDNGDFVVTWTTEDEGSGDTDVFAQRFLSDGTPQGTEFRVNSTTADRHYRSAVAVGPNGEFIITWDRSIFPNDADVLAQRYAGDGSLLGTAFRVNTETLGNQLRSSVAVDDDGDFVVAWEDEYKDGDEWGIFAQRFASDGTPQGGEFQVNVNTAGTQAYPSVGRAADGDFVIVWQSELVAGDAEEIVARRYSSNGTPLGLLFVNTYTTNSQRVPAVAVASNGDFIVTWASSGQEGPIFPTFSGIYAQCYDSAGAEVGSEFHVNTYTTEVQGFPTVGLADSGEFVVAWWSPTQPSFITGQRFAPLPGCSETPLTCDAPGKSVLKILENPDNPGKNKLVWKWLNGNIATQADFGAPTQSTGYALCIYDDGILDLEYSIAGNGICNGKPCWKELRDSKGFKYSNPPGTAQGIKAVVLKIGDGKARIVVKGRGENLAVPVGDPPFTQNVAVTVQLQSTASECWSADFASPAVRTSESVFHDKFP